MSSLPEGILKSCFSKRVLLLYAIALDRPLIVPLPTLSLDIKDLNKAIKLRNVTERIITQRLSAGCRLFVAYTKGNPVGYLFSSISCCTVDEIERKLYVMPGECYFYDAYTYPEYRGRGIYPYLLSFAARFFQRQAFHHALIFSLSQNQSSSKGIQKAGFASYGTVEFFNLLGRRFWRCRAKNGHIKSHFDDQKSSAQ